MFLMCGIATNAAGIRVGTVGKRVIIAAAKFITAAATVNIL